MNTNVLIAEAIVRHYAVTCSRRVVAMQKLDRKATQVPRMIALLLGTIAFLATMGGAILSMQSVLSCIPIVIMLLGTLFMCLNPLLYEKLLRMFRKRYAWDIVCLAKEVWLEERC